MTDTERNSLATNYVTANVSTYPLLFAELAKRGYSAADLAKIARGNILRVMRGTESTAATMAKSKNPI